MNCSVFENCLNQDKCWLCICEEPLGTNFYLPINKKIKNPIAEEKKRIDRSLKKADEKRKRSSDTSKRNKRAARVESELIQEIGAEPTVNSGRKYKDADGRTERFAIDVKYQSKTENPIIHVRELDKVRMQAIQNRREYGVLIIQNKSGRKFLVVDVEDGAFDLNV